MVKYFLLGLVLFLLIFIVLNQPNPRYELRKNDIKIIELHILNKIEYAVAMSPYILLPVGLSGKYRKKILKHEYVHIVQQNRDGWKFYCKYAWYFGENLWGCWQRETSLAVCWDWSYKSIPYEIEAYSVE